MLTSVGRRNRWQCSTIYTADIIDLLPVHDNGIDTYGKRIVSLVFVCVIPETGRAIDPCRYIAEEGYIHF